MSMAAATVSVARLHHKLDMPISHQKHQRRLTNRFRSSALANAKTEDLEAERLGMAWCNVVRNMNSSQLKRHAEDLLDIIRGDDRDRWLDADEGSSSEPLEEIRALYKVQRAKRPTRMFTEIERKVSWLGDLMSLDHHVIDFLCLLARVRIFSEWDALAALAAGRSSTDLTVATASILIDRSPCELENQLHQSRSANLHALVSIHGDGELRGSDLLLRVTRSPASSKSQLARQLLPTPAQSSLRWNDFAHLGEMAEFAAALVKSKCATSILLYGPPGTGKTEFAKLLGRRGRRKAIFAGEADEDGLEPDRNERVNHLVMLQALTRRSRTHLLVVDEADDILLRGPLHMFSRSSKLWLNRLVENVAVPTVWIMNDPETIDPALVRRMDLAIEFPKPSREIRRRIARRHAQEMKLPMVEPTLSEIASLCAPPAVIESALNSSKRVNGTADHAVRIGKELVRAMSGRLPDQCPSPALYDPSLSIADVDLDELAAQLGRAGPSGWSLLLSGPSGTGKSAFARHVAERIGIEVIEKRASDLLSKWVGESEKAIAGAFREAEQMNAMLVIDEADDFFFDRSQASQSWERTRINEMLQHLERLTSPFVATTNLEEIFDPATRRRFTVRASFKTLDAPRAARLFRHYFAVSLPKSAHPLVNQTPGDFDLVARRAHLLGVEDRTTLITWLQEEAMARSSNTSPAGF